MGKFEKAMFSLIDSGAGTTVIRKNFAKALGLQGNRERIDIAVDGGERITQNDSRRVKFWISPLNGKESYPVEAHELEHTISYNHQCSCSRSRLVKVI
jgi:hypothetical protein